MALRSARTNSFQVFEHSGDDRFAEFALLPNPTAGFNELGQRQVVGDLDGDGRLELVSGDGDGDLFAYEGAGDNTFRLAWSREDGRPHRDGRLVGGAADLDGDGRLEFAAATLFRDPLAPQRTYWTLSLYEATGDNAFAVEWQVEVEGGQAEGNGLIATDLNGDGQAELVAVLVPDLYVFAALGGAYQPVWHASVRNTYRPAAGDLDGDGRLELAFNKSGWVEVVRWHGPADGPPVPDGLVAYPQDDQGVVLEWNAVAAMTYRVYRDGQVVAADLATNRYQDDGLDVERTYSYQVSALAADGAEGPLSSVQTVRPALPPRPVAVKRLGRYQLAVVFSAPLAATQLQPYRFSVEPQVGQPVSALLDRGGRRLVLGFAAALPDSGRYRLAVRGLRGEAGAPLAAIDHPFELIPQAMPTRLLEARVLSPTRIRLRFNRPVEAIDGAVFTFDEADIRLERAYVEASGDLVLQLDPETPLAALGRRYRLSMENLTDGQGRLFGAAVGLSYAAADLAGLRVFPNPYRPRQGPLTVGGLPLGAQVSVYDLDGRLIRVLVEEDGDGGVQWDGRNRDGRGGGGRRLPVPSGGRWARTFGKIRPGALGAHWVLLESFLKLLAAVARLQSRWPAFASILRMRGLRHGRKRPYPTDMVTFDRLVHRLLARPWGAPRILRRLLRIC